MGHRRLPAPATSSSRRARRSRECALSVALVLREKIPPRVETPPLRNEATDYDGRPTRARPSAHAVSGCARADDAQVARGRRAALLRARNSPRPPAAAAAAARTAARGAGMLLHAAAAARRRRAARVGAARARAQAAGRGGLDPRDGARRAEHRARAERPDGARARLRAARGAGARAARRRARRSASARSTPRRTTCRAPSRRWRSRSVACRAAAAAAGGGARSDAVGGVRAPARGPSSFPALSHFRVNFHGPWRPARINAWRLGTWDWLGDLLESSGLPGAPGTAQPGKRPRSKST